MLLGDWCDFNKMVETENRTYQKHAKLGLHICVFIVIENSSCELDIICPFSSLLCAQGSQLLWTTSTR